jgi:hypothetical protein
MSQLNNVNPPQATVKETSLSKRPNETPSQWANRVAQAATTNIKTS